MFAIFFATVFFVPIVVLVVRIVTLICSGPQRSASTVGPRYVQVDAERFELVAQDCVLLAEHAVHDDDVALHALRERTHGRDPDSAGDERDLRSRAHGVGERPERAFRENARAGTDLSRTVAEVAEALDRDAERVAARRLRE